MHLPLRAKLILVMSVVVAGATVGTALVSMGVVRKAYEERFESDFKAEVRVFSQWQIERLDDLKRKCRSLAASKEMVAAVEKGEKTKISAIYSKEFEGGREGLEQWSGGFDVALPPLMFPGVASRAGLTGGKGTPGGASGRSSGGVMVPGKLVRPASPFRSQPAVAVVDAEGKLMWGDTDGKLSMDQSHSAMLKRPLDKNRLGAGDPGNDKSLREAFREILKKLATRESDEQEVCYTAGREGEAGGATFLRSSIVTPVLKKEKGDVVGAVILSVRTNDMGEGLLHRVSQEIDNETSGSGGLDQGISSGFWLNGELHTRTIPLAARKAVADLVGARVEEAKSDTKFHEATLSLPVGGAAVPHKLLFRVLNPNSPFAPACQVALYSLKEEIAEERALQQKISSIGLLALAVALVCVMFLSRNFTHPIRDLVIGTEQVRSGNYDVKVKVNRQDELGRLAESFNEMADGLRLNQKYQRLLSQVADRKVAEQLINNEAALGGELREVSVLFCDIRNFTKFTSSMPPGEVIAMLNEHMTALTETVHAHHGVVDKFVGDMVMALFGAPSAYGDDAERAALCALRMMQVREKINAQGGWQVHVGIGIATGTVIAGCMGSEERLDYTVLGEKVNLASRLCGQAGPGEILIDEGTREKLGSTAHMLPLPNLELKGFDQAVTAYRLCSMHQHAAEQAFDASALVQAEV